MKLLIDMNLPVIAKCAKVARRGVWIFMPELPESSVCLRWRLPAWKQIGAGLRAIRMALPKQIDITC